jgi:hypothetical protein
VFQSGILRAGNFTPLCVSILTPIYIEEAAKKRIRRISSAKANSSVIHGPFVRISPEWI